MSEFRVLEYQDTWPGQYSQVAVELRSAIPATNAALEHIGSTAVPGLCAKPVIDVLLGLTSLNQVDERVSALAAIGFIYRPEYESQIPQRRYFVKPEGQTLRVHLHAVIRGGKLWQQHLLFRDLLRNDQGVRTSYALLKKYIALLHASDKAAYTEAKAPFIKQVLATQSAQTVGASHGAA